MPFAKFTNVREVSSEDSIHLAENLIKCQPNKKWKTKNGGEKSAYVILEMASSYQITGIDIGNEHSAFVEVLVGNSTCAPEEFKEILITCSFMTPIESKSSNNTNRVRCFNCDALVPNVSKEKWSLVKIICTQPFNKHVQYGLSFIKVHVNDNTKNSSKTLKTLVSDQRLNETTKVIGKLKFRADSPDSDSDKCSSLFNRWKNSKHYDNIPTNSASEIITSKNCNTLTTLRLSDEQKSKNSMSQRKGDDIHDRNRENLLFGDEADVMNNKNQIKLERFSKLIEADKKMRLIEKEDESNNKKYKPPPYSAPTNVHTLPIKPLKSIFESNSSVNCLPSENVQKRKSLFPENSVKKSKLLKKYRPFNQLLKDVVLVISGIQNPDRGILRNKALALGAKYKPDWDSTCTHLICAFKSTPKYNQVNGKGKIVTRSWIENCYSLRKYLPWRRYALDSNELAKSESDEEIFDDTQNSEVEGINNNNFQYASSISIRESEARSKTPLDLYGIDEKSQECHHNDASSECDTDDEIKRVEKNIKAAKINATAQIGDIYEASTDEEEYIIEKLS